MSESSAKRKERQLDSPGAFSAVRGGATAPKAKPFIKWAGGKTKLLPELLSRLPEKYGRYFEPMVGGGALYFALRPRGAFLSDTNPELMNAYQVVRDNLEALLVDLKKHVYEEEYYYKLRNADRVEGYSRWSRVRKASRFIYLNKTCFNGLYRVNSKNQFNVPFGQYNDPTIVDEKNLRTCNKILKSATISADPFDSLLRKVKRGDFVYFDPPYAPISATSNFTSYTRHGFGDKEQRKLRDLCERLDKLGVLWMASNSAAPLIYDLYGSYQIDEVQAARAINSRGAKRGKIRELIIRNYSD